MRHIGHCKHHLDAYNDDDNNDDDYDDNDDDLDSILRKKLTSRK
jgi:hypothetical protein